MSKNLVLMFAVAVLAAAGGYFVAMKFSPGLAGQADDLSLQARDLVGQKRPDFSHVDATGKAVKAADFDGEVLLLNFWASWCAPCVEEMPMLSRVHQAWSGKGLRVLGIALDDPVRAADFAAGMALSYPILVGGADVVVTGRRYGNHTGMLPFSVLIDRKGVIRWTQLGQLEGKELEQEIRVVLASD